MSPLRTRARSPIVAPEVQVIEEERHWVVPKEEPKKDIMTIAKESSNSLSSEIGFADSLLSIMPSGAIDGKLLERKLTGLAEGLSSIDKNAAKRLSREIGAIGSMLEMAQSMKKENEKGAAELAKEAEAKLNDLLENRIPLARALDAIGTKEALLLKENYASTFKYAGTKEDWRDAMMFESIALYLDGKAASELVETAGAGIEKKVLALTKELSGGHAQQVPAKILLDQIREDVAGIKAEFLLNDMAVYAYRNRYAELLGVFGKDDRMTEVESAESVRLTGEAINQKLMAGGDQLVKGFALIAQAAKNVDGTKRMCQLYLMKKYASELDSWKIYKEMDDNEMAETTAKGLEFMLKLSGFVSGPSVKDSEALQSVLKWDERTVPDCGFVRSAFGALNLLQGKDIKRASLVLNAMNTYLDRVGDDKRETLDLDSKLALLSGVSAVLKSATDIGVKMKLQSASEYLEHLDKRFSQPIMPLDEKAAAISSSISNVMSKPFIWSLFFRKDQMDEKDIRASFFGTPQLVQRALGKAMAEKNDKALGAARLYTEKKELFDSEEMTEQKALLFNIMVRLSANKWESKANQTIKGMERLVSETESRLGSLIGHAGEIPKILSKSAPRGFEKAYRELEMALGYSLQYPYSLSSEQKEATRHMIQAAVWFAGEPELADPVKAKKHLDLLAPAALAGDPRAQAKLAMWHMSMFQHDEYIEEGRKITEPFKGNVFGVFATFDAMKEFSAGSGQRLMRALVPLGKEPGVAEYFEAAQRAQSILKIIEKSQALKAFGKPVVDGFVTLLQTTDKKYLDKTVETYASGLEKMINEGKLVADSSQDGNYKALFEVAAIAQSSRVKGSGALLKLVRELGPWTPASMAELGIISSVLKRAAAHDAPDKVFSPVAQKIMSDHKALGKDPTLKYLYTKALDAFDERLIKEAELSGIQKLDDGLPLLAYCMDWPCREALMAYGGHAKAKDAKLDIADLLTNVWKAKEGPYPRDKEWYSLVQSSLLFPLVGKDFDMDHLPKGMEWMKGVKGLGPALPPFSIARGKEETNKSADYLLSTKIRMLNWIYTEQDDSVSGIIAKAGITVDEFEEATGKWAVDRYEGKDALQKTDRDAIFQLAKKDIKLVMDAGTYRKGLAKQKQDDSEDFESVGQNFTKAIGLLDRCMVKFAKNEFAALKFTQQFKDELGIGYAKGGELFDKWKNDFRADHRYQQKNLRIVESGDLPDSLRMGVIGSTKSCQAFDDDRVLSCGLVGTIELPWIKKIVVYDENEKPIFRRVLMLVKDKATGSPVMLVQPVYEDSKNSDGLTKDLKKKLSEVVAARYGGASGIEIRDIKSPLSEDKDNPKNYDYLTYGSGESPFCYMDSNAVTGSLHGLHVRTSGAALDFSKDWRDNA